MVDVSAEQPSPAGDEVSIVIGASASEASLEGCLAALESQHHRSQVIVVEAQRSSDWLRARFPWAEFHERPGALVPELWRDGIDKARGRIVALTISQMIPAVDWMDAIVREHETHDAVGGAIDPGHGLRLVDWAEYFCRYARDMGPFQPAAKNDLPGDNASYKRVLLERLHDELRDGYWEPVVHRPLMQQGVELWHTPNMLVFQGRSTGFIAFARQRLAHGRRYGHQRGVYFSRTRNALGVVGSPAVPFLMTARVLRDVFRRHRYRARVLAALPLVFALNVVWAYAEARGHLDMLIRR
jgi:hypothetical protein